MPNIALTSNTQNGKVSTDEDKSNTHVHNPWVDLGEGWEWLQPSPYEKVFALILFWGSIPRPLKGKLTFSSHYNSPCPHPTLS